MAKQSQSNATKLDWQIFGCEINFKIENSKEFEEIKALQLDLTLYLECHFWPYQLIIHFQKFMKMTQIFRFLKNCSSTGTTEEAIANAEKLGFKTNLLAVNPLIKYKVPVYFKFVLMDYGFGAVLVVLLMIKEI